MDSTDCISLVFEHEGKWNQVPSRNVRIFRAENDQFVSEGNQSKMQRGLSSNKEVKEVFLLFHRDHRDTMGMTFLFFFFFEGREIKRWTSYQRVFKHRRQGSGGKIDSC